MEPWEIAWPQESSGGDPVDSYIQQASERYGIPEDRLRAVIGAESNFDPNAVSRVGAQGLMQLMPATARDLGVTDAFDPQQNIEGGSKYLAQLRDKYDGDWDRAHAAYNFGPGNVDAGKPLPKETQDYVAKINAKVGPDEGAPWEMPWAAPQAASEAAPWEMPWAEAKATTPAAQDNPDFQDLPSLSEGARVAAGVLPGAAETAVQMLAQIPQMGTQVLGMVKALADGKTSKADFEQATREMTPQWISDLANAEVLQPETKAGQLFSAGLGKLFEAAGEYPAAVGAGLKASLEAVANGEGTEGARKRFSDEYAKLAPVTGQVFNAALLAEGAHQIIKRAPSEVAGGTGTADVSPPIETQPDVAAPAATPAVDPMQAAAQKAIDLTNETGVEHTARQVDGQWTAVPKEDAAPSPAPDVLSAATVDDAIAAADKAAFPEEAEKTPPAAQVPAEAVQPVVEPQAPIPEPGAPAAPLETAHDLDQVPRPAEDAARNVDQPATPLGAGGDGDAGIDAPRAEGGQDAGTAQGDHRLGEVAPEAVSGAAEVARAPLESEATAAPEPVESGPRLQDFTTAKGQVKTFDTAAAAEEYRFKNARAMRGYTAREAEPGEWRFSRPERVRSEAQKANDRRLAANAKSVLPTDSLDVLMRKSGGINAAELTRDGADPESVSASLRFGAARKNGGMSLDGMAEVMASHGYDVYDEHGAIDATKARDLIQDVLDGNKVYSPEGLELRAAAEQRNRDAGFAHDDEILRQADLAPEDGVDAGMVARAAEINEGHVERLAIQYEGDDAGFTRAVQEFLDDPNHEVVARGETAPAQEAGEAADPAEALARLKRAAEAVRAAKPNEVGPLMGELDSARQAAEVSGATSIQLVHALETPRSPLTPEERLRVLERGEPKPPKAEAPADAGVSTSTPRIEDAPPALLRRVMVSIDRFHEGEGVKTENVPAHEALAEHDAEISAFEKLLECLRA